MDKATCHGCGACVEVGHCDAITMADVASIDPKLCKGCSTCIDICPQKAIQMMEQRGPENP